MSYRSPTNIDRRGCCRTVPMKVLVLGLSRTGTDCQYSHLNPLSRTWIPSWIWLTCKHSFPAIRKALMQLGYLDTYHGYEAAAENPRDCELWLEAFGAKFDGDGKVFGRKEFDQLLGHCQAVCDGPATCFTPELIAAYPEAKVILSNRDVDEWHQSVTNTLLKNIFTAKAVALSILAWVTRSPNRWTRPMFVRVFTDCYSGDFERNGKRVFQEHYEMVRSLVPKENLLEYQVQDGWAPLCQFLGAGVPLGLFPNGNTKEELEQRIGEVVNHELRRISELVIRVCAGLIGFLLIICLVQLMGESPGRDGFFRMDISDVTKFGLR